jgi:lantibiotic leader peptide-processing serine protease
MNALGKRNEAEESLLRHSGRAARLFVGTLITALALAFAGTAGAARYLVVYKSESMPKNAAASIQSAGGQLVMSYDDIGVAIADSSSDAFSTVLLDDKKVDGVSALDGLSFGLEHDSADWEGDLPNIPATDADTFSALQWNMRQIHAPEAHAVTGGSPAVVVGLLDSGIDYTHPDLAQNIDFEDSASCVSGVPDTNPLAWKDDNGHGTHNAGTIAAASNGFGIVGVAPNVRLASVKVAQPSGLITPAAVVCGFMWSATHHIDVTNNSYTIDVGDTTGADALDFFCHNDPAQQPLITAVKRSVRYALKKGVPVVASAGNSNIDLAHPPTGNECIRLPSELPGVIAVTATALSGQKASYSNYGVGFADVAAPGGDAVPAPPAGFVLSTWPAYLQVPRLLQDSTPLGPAYYRFMAGTSMAAAHASGVAALIVSRYGTLKQGDPSMRPGRVEAYMQQTATPVSCPPDPTGCQGDSGYNGFYGHGIVDALAAVTR